jgi:hypothetical protein
VVVAVAATGVVLAAVPVAVAETGVGVILGRRSCCPIWRFCGTTVGLAAVSACRGMPCAAAMLERVSPAFTRYVPARAVAEAALVLVPVPVAVGISARGEVAAGLGATVVASGRTGVAGGGLLAQAAAKSSSGKALSRNRYERSVTFLRIKSSSVRCQQRLGHAVRLPLRAVALAVRSRQRQCVGERGIQPQE